MTLAELLVVLGIVIVLVAILLPAVAIVRRSAQATHCASNLRSVGQALANYAVANRDWVPRENSAYGEIALRSPFMTVLRAVNNRDAVDDYEMYRVAVLQCPMHPLDGWKNLPTAYVSNGMPNIRGHQIQTRYITTVACRVSAVRRSSSVVYITEAADRFSPDPIENDLIQLLAAHDVWEERQLKSRISSRRHGAFSNALMFDWSVTRRTASQLAFEDFDDGMRGGSKGRILLAHPPSR